MRLACFTMFHNEAAILGPFLDQVEAFFDYATLLDHGSTDDGAALVRARTGARIDLHHLKAPGYPQSAVATLFGRRIMAEYQPDFLFLLDCDEFLPFANRAELEAFLTGLEDYHTLSLHWLNICPSQLDGANIFATPFLRASAPSETITKVVLSRHLATQSDWMVAQGYHSVVPTRGTYLHTFSVTDRFLYHIPVQSRAQFHFKIASGARRLLKEQVNLRRNQGWHWVELARDLSFRHLSNEALTAIALHYPAEPPNGPGLYATHDFAFPYIRAPYHETAVWQSGRIQGLLRQFTRQEGLEAATSFTVTDEAGEVLFSSGGPVVRAGATPPQRQLPHELFESSFAEDYAALVEPLFCLPAKLPPTAWSGHIPFLFVLFRALRPETYVELGVHYGASLIAAATAAATYQLNTAVVGIDSWQGDEHSGRYEGDTIYQGLRSYVAATFPNARLERCLFSEALPRFARESVDILHIDGLHTYDAVKKDFTEWFDRVSPTGVILLHDIAVYERGFGVHRLWGLLKERFTTLEFHHCYGLGVVLLAPEDERLRPLVTLARDQRAMRTYQSLVADVARVLPERMDAYAQGEETAILSRAAAKAQRKAFKAFSSSRISRPLRKLRKMLRC